ADERNQVAYENALGERDYYKPKRASTGAGGAPIYEQIGKDGELSLKTVYPSKTAAQAHNLQTLQQLGAPDSVINSGRLEMLFKQFPNMNEAQKRSTLID
ncbi:hypothetical protein, partial [Oenococcus oeni]|uniref:hypothetical protein n=1 Tax=Oenococcus oeni TaxID=1247 RepID=UPI0015D6741D